MTTVAPAICPLDCPDTCSLDLTVDNGRIAKIRGSHANPITDGSICGKVSRYFTDFVHGELRLTTPLIRRGDGFEPISWDEALTIAVERTQSVIDEYGPQAVLPLNYAGPHGQLGMNSMDRRFFHRLGASLLDRGPLCGGVRGAAYASLFGTAPGMPLSQVANADLIAVWGNNVTVSNMHLAPAMKAARENGARVVVVDPKRTRAAEQAHLHIQPQPGTDVVLALALAAEFEGRDGLDRAFIDQWVTGFDEFMAEARRYSLEDAARICRIPLESVQTLADWYLESQRLTLSIGNGIERGASGGSALRAIMSLNALLGQFGRPGAGVLAKPGLSFPLTTPRLQATQLIPEGTRTLNIIEVGQHMLEDDIDPPIRAVFIYNHNPVATHPGQGRMVQALRRDDIFKVGIDVVMTDSMRLCDLVLPACSPFECDDLYTAYGHGLLQRAQAAIPPVGEALPNSEIFRRLAKAFGFDEPLFDDDDAALMDAALDGSDDRLNGYAPSQIPLETTLDMQTAGGRQGLLCADVKPGTASGRIELFSDKLEQEFGCGAPRYRDVLEGQQREFVLITPSSSKRTNSTFGGHADSSGPEIVEMNPEDAERHGLADGKLITLGNELGKVSLKLRVSDAVRPGVLYSPKGTWLKTSNTGQTVNGLIDADLRTDFGNGACYNDTFVDLLNQR
ncbi:MAG: molybdopterin-containing oxidoreductase family protein [Gammaproteobacteria bacterium]